MRIEGAKAWYAHNETQRKQNSKTVQSHQLATRLLQISEQQYLHAVEHERRVADEFNKAYDNYLALGGPLAQIHFLDSQVKRMQMTHTALIEQISHYQSRQQNEALTETTMYPFPPRSPASPQLVIVILGSTFIGLFFGLGTIYIIDTLDDRFRSPEELTIQLGVPVLAMVRQMEETGGTGADSLQTFHNPNGVESEAFRTLRTAVAFSDTSMRIMATSSEPGDGKTTVMANLAVAYAQSGKRTLLIDADMRRPGMSTLFELRGPQGLSHILKDDAEISASIEKNMTRGLVNHLDFIPSGTRPLNPTELLSGDRFPELLAWAETIYDQILIDAPPILAVTDPAIVGRVVDGVILVIRPETNKRNMVIRATEQLKAVDLNLLGVVVNRASAEFGGDEYGNGFGYGYGYGYGHGYGHTNEDSDEPDDGIDKPDTLPLPIRDAA
jgi:capsular exopolysaccharide synthesis family protein